MLDTFTQEDDVITGEVAWVSRTGCRARGVLLVGVTGLLDGGVTLTAGEVGGALLLFKQHLATKFLFQCLCDSRFVHRLIWHQPRQPLHITDVIFPLILTLHTVQGHTVLLAAGWSEDVD